MPTLYRLELTAYHESGHAVAFIDNGIPFRYVTIRSSESGTDGRVMLNRRKLIDPDPAGYIIVSGPIAQGVYTHKELTRQGGAHRLDKCINDAWEDGGWGDGAQFADLKRRCGTSVDPDSPDYVLSRWDAISALAESLLQSNKRITHREALDIVKGV